MKYIIDIKGEIEGDYEIIGKYEERPMGERKKGKWLPDNSNIIPHFVCSVCGISQQVETVMYEPIWAYCPRCGSDMRGNPDEQT